MSNQRLCQVNKKTNSASYNDDPDSFIIGDRVWVQGIKPGYIVYIGEVQFAKGDWVGVVLDKPEGKNDGSVRGVRYFQCPYNRGLFTRLHRLTRLPIDMLDANNNLIISTDGNNTSTVKTHRTCSSDGKITTTVTRITKSPANIPHYALPIKPTKVITTVTTTTTTVGKPKSVLKSSCRVVSNKNKCPTVHRVHF